MVVLERLFSMRPLCRVCLAVILTVGLGSSILSTVCVKGTHQGELHTLIALYLIPKPIQYVNQLIWSGRNMVNQLILLVLRELQTCAKRAKLMTTKVDVQVFNNVCH